jgi:hypothetical protein
MMTNNGVMVIANPTPTHPNWRLPVPGKMLGIENNTMGMAIPARAVRQPDLEDR